MSRVFTHYDMYTAVYNGKIESDQPYRAATKYASNYYKDLRASGGDTTRPIIFILKEITPNSDKLLYFYRAVRKRIEYKTVNKLVFIAPVCNTPLNRVFIAPVCNTPLNRVFIAPVCNTPLNRVQQFKYKHVIKVTSLSNKNMSTIVNK